MTFRKTFLRAVRTPKYKTLEDNMALFEDVQKRIAEAGVSPGDFIENFARLACCDAFKTASPNALPSWPHPLEVLASKDLLVDIRIGCDAAAEAVFKTRNLLGRVGCLVCGANLEFAKGVLVPDRPCAACGAAQSGDRRN